jgi:hypothetical protein
MILHAFVSFVELGRGGGTGGGGGFRTVCIGVIGVCKEAACVYNSSSDEEGEDDNEDSVGESKGFIDRRASNA